jgi:predicted phage terminase large subunit-like protein
MFEEAEQDHLIGQLIRDVGEPSYIEEVREECAKSLYAFIQHCWPIMEPSMPFAGNWHIQFICEHLEAITNGVQYEDGSYYNRLLVNIPPGCMKSLLVNCFWPLHEWGPKNLPHMRYICASHSQDIAIRDGLRMRRVVESRWYQKLWPHVQLTADQNQKTRFENTASGWRMAAAAGSITGHRADRIVIDDPISMKDSMSAQIKETTNTWLSEAVPTRLSSPEKSAILMIMQRLAEDDPSGYVLDNWADDWDHICLPMRYESARSFPTKLGFEDPRTVEGQLLFPDRFPSDVVDRDEKAMGVWATAGQHQQAPSPRGGGILPRTAWKLWETDNYPNFDYVIATLDTAFTTKEENDPSAMCIFGVWSGADEVAQIGRSVASREDSETIVARQMQDGHPKVMLMYAWNERLEFHDLVERVREACVRYQVDNLIIENKAAGISVAQELRRVYGSASFGVQLVDPKNADKVSRLYAIQHLFMDGLVYAPDKTWAEQVIHQCSVFPKSKHDDLVDCVSMGMGHLRKTGALLRGREYTEQLSDSMLHKGSPPAPLYQC